MSAGVVRLRHSPVWPSFIRGVCLLLQYLLQSGSRGGGGGTMEDMCYVCVCVFITAGPNTKLFALGGGDIGGHVLRETTSRGLCGLVCLPITHSFFLVCLLLQNLIQSCSRGGRRIVEDMCYQIRRAEACVD